MLEKFKIFFNTLNDSDKKEAILYILNSQSVNEGLYTGSSTNIEKGLYTGPTSSSEKCPTCGK